jgi:glucose/mannose-6-phosphate isomerase
MPSILDDSRAISRLDSKDMLGAIGSLPEFMLSQLEDKNQGLGRVGGKVFRNIVFMGMGGSASAADIALDWLSHGISVPTMVHRDPTIPEFVRSDTLFVALSYSGETRETLVAFRKARKRGASLVGIGTGGKLRELLEDSDFPFLDVGSAPAPRAALGQMIVACAQALQGYRVVQNTNAEIRSVVQELRHLNSRLKRETRYTQNPAKRLAPSLKDRIPVIFAFRRMAAVARRFKNQLAENSKVVAKYSLLPEAAHNEIEGWHKQRLSLAPIFIRDFSESDLEESMLRSFRSTITRASGVASEQVRLNSRTRLGALLSPVLFLDYVSVYLALLRGIDPTDTPWIRQYKGRL